jgi:ribonuclease BN (tRNA processing enzyme)
MSYINFLGVGSAFSIERGGNCSAFTYYENNSLLLFDCGETVLKKIISEGILKDISSINILITHFHSDHIGSLGSLIFYCDYLGISNVNIIYPKVKKMLEVIKLFGVDKANFKILLPEEVEDFKIETYNQEHSHMESFGYLCKFDETTIYYSGDTKSVPPEIIKKLLKNEIDYLYHDIHEYGNNYHISIDELAMQIPESLRHKVWCMHLSDEISDKKILKLGFNIVKPFK